MADFKNFAGTRNALRRAGGRRKIICITRHASPRIHRWTTTTAFALAPHPCRLVPVPESFCWPIWGEL